MLTLICLFIPIFNTSSPSTITGDRIAKNGHNKRLPGKLWHRLHLQPLLGRRTRLEKLIECFVEPIPRSKEDHSWLEHNNQHVLWESQQFKITQLSDCVLLSLQNVLPGQSSHCTARVPMSDVLLCDAAALLPISCSVCGRSCFAHH